ncbi:ABC transporter permease [Bdellovibrio sp. HCB2-146]|uniref:ABC transporter permease n=1 Tax=Bdellovibrio sp. HCB2-146 TaxID=3394362 RepID=UPI0039BC67BD
MKKILELITSLAVLATLLFLLLRLLPGGPFDLERTLDPSVQKNLSESWGIHNLTDSMIRPDQSVFGIILQGLSNTLSLNLMALFIVLMGSLGMSLLVVRYRGGWFEQLINQMLIVFVSLPSLFWGPFLIYLFAFYFDLLPVALLNSPASYILPVLTLSIRPFATLVRLLQTSLLTNIQQDYARTAIAKGLTSWEVLVKHVLRNSSMAFLSYLGPLTVSLVSGSFLVEILFAIPGLGTEFVQAINDRDYTVIAGITLFYGCLLLSLNTLIEIVQRNIDPRLKEDTP